MRTALRLLLALAAASFLGTPAWGQARLKVLADTPLRPALVQIATAYHAAGGEEVEFVFGPSPVILKRLADGETGDVLIAQPNHLANLVRAGTVLAGDHPALGRVGLGLGVRADAPPQRIDTVESFRETLLKADKLVFNNSVAGDLVAGVLERMGIADAVRPKVVRPPPNPQLYDLVTKGTGNEVVAGILPLIRDAKGVRALGPFPAELQVYQSYAAAALSGARSRDAAARFIAFLTTPAARASFAAHDVE